jgi:putative oxidoreductase
MAKGGLPSWGGHRNIKEHAVNVSKITQIAFVLGRLLVGGVYIWASVDNLKALDGAIGYAASKGTPLPGVVVPIAALLLLAAGFSIIAGFRPLIGVGALVLFLLPVTIIMHNYWALQGLQSMLEMHSFQANIGLLGSGLMFLAIPRPWPFSLDSWLASSASRRIVAEAANTA